MIEMRLSLIVYAIALLLGFVVSGIKLRVSGPRIGLSILAPVLFLAATVLLARETYFVLNGKSSKVSFILHASIILSCTTFFIWFFSSFE